jgi:inner membrane protein
MLLFGHLGLTLGTAWASGHGCDKLRARKQPLEAGANKLRRLASKIDYRVVLIGSMLPDIIDKPLGLWVLHDEYGGGRSFAHTLLFALILIMAGLIWHRKKRGIFLLTLALANAMHLVLDSMWTRKETLLWPVLGRSFYPSGAGDLSQALSSWWKDLLANPATYIPEIAGALILSLFLLTLIRKKKLLLFIKSGKAE